MNKEVLMNAFGQFLDEVLAQRQDDVLGGMVVDAVQQYLGECIDEAVDESINRLDSSAVAETLDLATKYDIQCYVDENCLDRESVCEIIDKYVFDYDFHEDVSLCLEDCDIVTREDLEYAVDHIDLDDQIDNALDGRDLVYQDDLEYKIDDILTDRDYVERCELSDAVSEILYDEDLVKEGDLEELMDDLGYGAWVDTTAQFMEEMRQKMAILEMRLILADLEALKNE